MRYKDLLLEGGLGWGKFGTVVRGTLRKDSDTQRCVHPVARLEMGQGGSEHQWRVAVKFMAGGSVEGGVGLCIVWSSLSDLALLVAVTNHVCGW